MALLRISTVGEKVLREVAKPVTEFNEELKKLSEDMAETMKAADGVGLAAPQIGLSLRIFVIDFGYIDYTKAESEGRKPSKIEFRSVTFVNPEIVSRFGVEKRSEGCLSIPNFTADVERAERVVCKYFDVEGKEHTIEEEGLAAVAIQHEFDHLEGRLFIDKVSSLKRDMAMRKVKKYLNGLKDSTDAVELTLYGKNR